MLEYLFYALFFLVPLIFYPRTSEVFEFNKIVLVYIFTTLIAAVWITKMIQSKKIIFRRTILDIPLLIFLGSQILSTIFSIDQRTSLFGYYSRFNGGLVSTISYSLLYWSFVSNVKRKSIKYIVYSILASATIVAIYGIFEHFGASFSCIIVHGQFNDNCWVQDVKTRVFATLGQPNWLAAYLVSLVPLTWYFALKTKQSKTKIICITASVLFFACILFTGSRSGLLALAVALAIFGLFNSITALRAKRYFKELAFISVLFLIIGGVFMIPLGAINHAPAKTTDQGEGGTESGAIRAIVWKGAIDIFKHNPVFGTGVETFGYSYWRYRPAAHNNTSEWDFLYNKAHNEYLNFAANTGIVGLGSYLILIGTSVWVSRKTPALLAGYISILITNFFGFSVVVISLFTFLFPAIAIILKDV